MSGFILRERKFDTIEEATKAQFLEGAGREITDDEHLRLLELLSTEKEDLVERITAHMLRPGILSGRILIRVDDDGEFEFN